MWHLKKEFVVNLWFARRFELKFLTQNAWFDSWFGFGCSCFMIRFVIRIRSIRIYDSDSWFGFGSYEFMIRIRDSDSVIQIYDSGSWFGFGHSEFMIRIRDSPNQDESRIMWFANHMIRRSLNKFEKNDVKLSCLC